MSKLASTKDKRLNGKSPRAIKRKQEPEQLETSTQKMETFVVFVLDQSGSMGSIAKEARSFFNEHLDDLKRKSREDKSLAIRASLVTFCGTVNVKRFNENIGAIAKLRSYPTSGTTSLYDAIATAITRIENLGQLNKEAAVLVIIVTDGLENSSTDYSCSNDGTARIRALIESKRQTGQWTFAFMGASENVIAQAAEIGIHAGNVMAFVPSAQGLRKAGQNSQLCVMSFMECRSRGSKNSENFFGSSRTDQSEQAPNSTPLVSVESADDFNF